MTLGAGTGLDAAGTWWCVAVWNLALVAAALFCFQRGRTPGLRVLAAFLVLHVFGVGLGGGLTSRQMIVVQVPVSLFSAWVLAALASRLAAAFESRRASAAARKTPGIVALLLILAAHADHRVAARIAIRAGNAARDLSRSVAVLAPAQGPPVTVTLINLPAAIVEKGMASMLFSNGPVEISRLASPAVGRVELRSLTTSNIADYVLERPQIGADELRAQVEDPDFVVLAFFGRPFELEHVERDTIESVLAGH
jgi:hypothetical protein